MLASNVSLGASGQQYRVNGLGQRDAKVTGTAPDLSGDANQDGTLNSADLTLINNMLQGTAAVNLAGDCNKDGSITATDSTCTQAKITDMKQHPANYVQTGTYFVYDQTGHLLGEYNQNGSVIQETVWLGDMPVAVLQGNKPYYIYADHLNAPRAISDSSGTVIWRWDSEAFGTQAANEDPDGNHVTFSYNLRFPGQYYDSETGLFYNGFRDYNPSIGRYVESDPIGLAGGLNTYTYVDNIPLLYIDPTGENPVIDCLLHPTACANAAKAAAKTVVEICKKVPNPFGKKGGLAHQAKVAEKIKEIESRGLEASQEYKVPTPDGAKGSRYVDVVAKDTEGKVIEMYQVGQETQAGNPVAREVGALNDIEAASGTRPTFVPYNK